MRTEFLLEDLSLDRRGEFRASLQLELINITNGIFGDDMF